MLANNKDICFVSVGTNSHTGKSARLRNCLNKFNIPNIIWEGEYPPGSPTHEEVPYGFKAYAIKEAIQRGYEKVFWLDNNFVVVDSNLEPMLEMIKKDGCFLYRDMTNFNYQVPGEKKLCVGTWCKDSTLEYFRVTRERAFDIPQILAGIMGFDFSNEETKVFFDRILELVQYNGGELLKGSHNNHNGCVSKDPRVLGHRHDLIIVSLLAHQMNMPTWYPGPERDIHSNNPLYIQYGNWPPKSKDVIFIHKRN